MKAIRVLAFVAAITLASCATTLQTPPSPGLSAMPTEPATDVLPSIAPGTPQSRLTRVRSWLYLIDVNLQPSTIQTIEGSAHDLVVLDFIPSEANNTDFPIAEVVAELQGAAHPKMVLAYIDIGQAEDFRTYWRRGWEPGNPDWIAGTDPDGWAGNYPVAFWRDEWQAIWLGTDGYLQAIVDAGFDGVYLDWVEAYSDENVAAVAEAEGIDARAEMVRWVSRIAAFGRARTPGFVVIAQNAAELARDDGYAGAIDAIAQEQVWFDGGADNEPPGDCPLPRTDSDIESETYYHGLSSECRRQYDQYPESTLHVSSESYLQELRHAKSKGLTILTVDYAVKPENAAWVYRTSRELGFIPFVGSRALDEYVHVSP